MKILVIQKKLMGDVLIASTVFPLLKEKFPKAHISLLVDEKHVQILKENPFIDQFLFFDKKLSDTVAKVKQQQFDLVIDLYSTLETGTVTFLSGAKKRIGFDKKYSRFFYNFPVKRSKILKSKNTTFAIEHRLQMLEPLGIPFREAFPALYLSEKEIVEAREILSGFGCDAEDELVMISTFGSEPEKTYPIEYMAEIINSIAAYKPEAKILCNYLPSQQEMFFQLYEMLSPSGKTSVVKDFDTQNLREFAAVTSLCKCMIGNEGGATNISKSLNIPTFTIFSPHIKLEDWAWTNKPEIDQALHVSNFVPVSEDYIDFKPEFLVKDLQRFLDKTIH